jgi:hypothetical protein
MTIAILHLSDIHIRDVTDPILKNANAIASCLYSALPDASHVFIVVSGDIAYSGQRPQYDQAVTFLREIKTAVIVEKAVPVDFILTPGNHDCDFSRDSSVRKMLIDSMDGSNAPAIDEDVVNACTTVQSEFLAFRDRMESVRPDFDDRLWRSTQFNVEGKRVSFDCLNLSWVSRLPEAPGRLHYPIASYESMSLPPCDVRILVLHQPPNWLNQSVYRAFRKFIRTIADLVISGHEHQGNVGIISESETGSSAFVEGCALQDKTDLSDSSFNVILLDVGTSKFSVSQYFWKGDRYFTSEDASWKSYHDLPAKRVNPFSITEAFGQQLDDAGALFKHPSRATLSLADIFVFPDLRKLGTKEDQRRVLVGAETLASADFAAKGILLKGEEKAGRTTLLLHLYRVYHERGAVPLLISGKDLKRLNEESIDELLDKAVSSQYGKNHVELFRQLSGSKKLLLVDDLDDSPLKAAEALAWVLSTLKRRFGGLIVTVDEMFEIREVFEAETATDLGTLEHYQIQPFGYARRSQLIQKWFSIGLDGTVDEGSFIARCDQAERIMDAAMKKAIMPSLPLYLLTLLQSFEAGRAGDFKDTALGYYYQYLITQAFQSCNVKPDKFTELFQYVSHLAWAYHLEAKGELSDGDLRDFNREFSKKWHTVEFDLRIELLVNARVLARVGSEYSFRYPYVYYYLKGQYLSANLGDLDIRAYIRHCCQHLYVREHANTVLFLAHHTTDDFVLTAISEALHSVFRSRAPVTFESEPELISQLIAAAPALTYSGTRPLEHRKQQRELKDQMDDGSDGLAEREEQRDALSLFAQVTMLFKTVEILGQVLKNQYSTIQRVRKRELVDELFKGPLRALQDFYEFLAKNPDVLVAAIEESLKASHKMPLEEDRNKFARKLFGRLVETITYAFVIKAAQSAHSDNLMEDVRDVVKNNGTMAFKIIELGIILDSPRSLPKSQLKTLLKQAGSGSIASRLMRAMVVNRLYMFKTTEADMQWLSTTFDVSMQFQHTISYQDKGRRKLK